VPDINCANLLVEIGTEELPPAVLRKLGETFASGCAAALAETQLVTEYGPFRWFATPRRLAAWIPDVALRQPDRTLERRGPSVAAAFDAEGNPTRAAVGFASSCGVAIDRLERVRTPKGEWLVFQSRKTGEPAHVLIPGCIDRVIGQLPIPKGMRWSNLEAEFVRPVHWLVVLHGENVVATELLSVSSGRLTRGHRFHCAQPLSLQCADDYEQMLLNQGFVVADFEKRKQQIKLQVNDLAHGKEGTASLDDDDLLEQVTGLVEWPKALIGEFDRVFLQMPAEVLVSSMRDHQKYFNVSGGNHGLLPYFVTVSNIDSNTPDRIRQGNERVLKARLADARFFWDSDQKSTMEQHGARLGQVLFHRKLGTVADKVDRLKYLSRTVAPLCDADSDLCVRAAQLVKADLVTDMVGEFPDLQGVMGYYYARHDGEEDDVAQACRDHYLPRFSGDALPRSTVARVIALVDRIDSLVGIFAAGEEPSGDKDPFALRRSALGILRLLIEGGLALDLRELLLQSAQAYGVYGAEVDPGVDTIDRIYGFVVHRLQGYYIDQGFGIDEIASVAAGMPTRPVDFDQRLRAVAKFRQLGSAVHLAAANKRIRNILRQAEGQIPEDFDRGLARDPAEKHLADRLRELEASVGKSFDAAQYESGLEQLATLRDPVDRFFDEVMVMVDDEALRQNRLALLNRLHGLFLRVADIALLQEPSENKESAAR